MKISFVGISVVDIDVSTTFYSQILEINDFNRFDSKSGSKCTVFRMEDKVVQLIQRPNRGTERLGTGPLDHLGFEVTGLQEHVRRLRELGVVMLYDEIKIGPETQWMLFEGPDGERLEFLEFLHQN